jgi:secreted trypsin-like serine protease
LVYTESDGLGSVIGVFSYGYAEGSCPGQKTLFTRVSTYLDWIVETISGGSNTTALYENSDFEDDTSLEWD